MTRSAIRWTLLMILVLATTAAAQQPAPAVDQILDKYVTAIGGKTALEKVTSRVSTGTIDLTEQGLTLPVELYSKAPNKRLVVVDAGEYGKFQQGFDGTVAWGSNQNGIMEMTGGDLANSRRNSVFQSALELRKTYPTMTLLPDEKVGDQSARVILAEPGDGAKVWLYFDATSGLLIRAKTERDSAQEGGRTNFDLRLEDYREFDGMKLPFVFRQTSPTQSYIIRLSEVKHNVPIEDSKFAKPSAQ